MAKCPVEECPNEATKSIQIHINSYTDHTKRTRRRCVLNTKVCTDHQYVHGYAWTRAPYPMIHMGAFPADYKEFHKK